MVRFPKLSVEIWDRRMLLKIALAIGTPLFIKTWRKEVITGGFVKAYIQIYLSQLFVQALTLLRRGDTHGSNSNMTTSPPSITFVVELAILKVICSHMKGEEAKAKH